MALAGGIRAPPVSKKSLDLTYSSKNIVYCIGPLIQILG